MRISEMNWMMVEEYLKRDDRALLPLGSTEQHAYLSLSVDSILAERLAVEAAEPLGVPVFPVVAYGITPYFRAFPGTITLRVETYLSLLRDILDVKVRRDPVGHHRSEEHTSELQSLRHLVCRLLLEK